MFFRIPLLVVGLSLLTTFSTIAQGAFDSLTFNITDITTDPKRQAIKIQIAGYNQIGAPLLQEDKSRFQIIEHYNSSTDTLELEQVHALNPEDYDYVDHIQPMRVLFLVDLSGSMYNKLSHVRKAILEAMDPKFTEHIEFQVAWFHNEIGPSDTLSLFNCNKVLNGLSVDLKHDTDLHRAIVEKVDEMKVYPGNKIMILLTDGENDIRRNPLYYGEDALQPLTAKDVQDHLLTLDTSFRIFPIGIGEGPNEEFLHQVVDATSNVGDTLITKVEPEVLKQTTLRLLQSFEPNFELIIHPSSKHDSGKRQLEIVYKQANKVLTTEIETSIGGHMTRPDRRLKNGSNPLYFISLWYRSSGFSTVFISHCSANFQEYSL